MLKSCIDTVPLIQYIGRSPARQSDGSLYGLFKSGIWTDAQMQKYSNKLKKKCQIKTPAFDDGDKLKAVILFQQHLEVHDDGAVFCD